MTFVLAIFLFSIGLLLMPAAASLATTTVGENTSIGGTLGVTGVTTLTAALVANGAVTLGDATGDVITITGRLAADLDPNANNTIDFGAYDLAYNDVFTSGTVYANTFYGGTLTATSTVAFDGNTTLGSDATDTITLNGRISSGVWASSTLYVGSAAGGEDLVVTNNAVTVGTSVNSSTLDVFGATTVTGNLRPQTSHNNLYNLGGWEKAWSNIFSSSTIYGKHANFTGDVTIGDDTSDSVIINGRISTFLLPNAHNLGDIGSYTSAWKDIYSSSTIYGNAANFTGSVTLGNSAPGTEITINGQVNAGTQLVPNVPNNTSLGSFANTWFSVFASNTIYAKDAVFSNTVGTSSLYLKSFGNNTGSEVILEDVDGNGCASIMVKDGVLVVSAVNCPAF